MPTIIISGMNLVDNFGGKQNGKKFQVMDSFIPLVVFLIPHYTSS